jgi:hypothetical protein
MGQDLEMDSAGKAKYGYIVAVSACSWIFVGCVAYVAYM